MSAEKHRINAVLEIYKILNNEEKYTCPNCIMDYAHIQPIQISFKKYGDEEEKTEICYGMFRYFKNPFLKCNYNTKEIVERVNRYIIESKKFPNLGYKNKTKITYMTELFKKISADNLILLFPMYQIPFILHNFDNNIIKIASSSFYSSCYYNESVFDIFPVLKTYPCILFNECLDYGYQIGYKDFGFTGIVYTKFKDMNIVAKIEDIKNNTNFKIWAGQSTLPANIKELIGRYFNRNARYKYICRPVKSKLN